MKILFHSSKSMRESSDLGVSMNDSLLFEGKASQLMKHLDEMSTDEIKKSMKVSDTLAEHVQQLNGSITTGSSLPAADAFIGDMYSGLGVREWDAEDWMYANKHLRILSGLYGVLRPADPIRPYRLEMGYPAAPQPHTNLYSFWGDILATEFAGHEIVDLSAKEYTKAIFPHLTSEKVVSPKFMTFNKKLSKPKFVTIHAKIARGIFAHWMIANKVSSIADITTFHEHGYQYLQELSTPEEPVFVCSEFLAKGLSIRLS